VKNNPGARTAPVVLSIIRLPREVPLSRIGHGRPNGVNPAAIESGISLPDGTGKKFLTKSRDLPMFEKGGVRAKRRAVIIPRRTATIARNRYL
jgi:hypothetical protein